MVVGIDAATRSQGHIIADLAVIEMRRSFTAQVQSASAVMCAVAKNVRFIRR
jgi:hypothetical protein